MQRQLIRILTLVQQGFLEACFEGEPPPPQKKNKIGYSTPKYYPVYMLLFFWFNLLDWKVQGPKACFLDNPGYYVYVGNDL